MTRHHAHHYLGFARNQWRMFENEPKLKTLLYCYRVLLTGIHLMRTGEVQANLAELLTMDLHPGVLELLQAKRSGTERQSLPEGAWLAQHRSAITALMEQLERAHAESDLPERPSAFDALDDLVARLRTRGVE